MVSELVSTFCVLLRQRYLIVASAILGLVGAVLVRFLEPRSYSATVTFVVQTRSAQLGMSASLASRLGVAGVVGDPSNSPMFYAELVTSRELLRSVLQDTNSPLASQSRDYLYGGAAITDARREQAVDRLLRMVTATTRARTGVVQVSVRAPSASLAADVATALVRAVERFNRSRRRSQAESERRFTEQRMRVALGELRNAEDDVQRFLSSNRDFRSAPHLQLVKDRLERVVIAKQAVYDALYRKAEDARMEEVRDTPLLTVIDTPTSAVDPDPRRILLVGALGLLFGAIAGAFAALLLEHVRAQDWLAT